MAGLKLRAGDSDDFAVISAILQDALVTIGEMVYLPDESRFVLVANRFRWEPEASGARKNFERTLSGICFDGVKAVQRRGFNPSETDRILSLLAIRVDTDTDPAAKSATILLEFAGGSSVRLDVTDLLCHLDDLGEPWPTRWRPKHPVADRD